MGDPDHVLPAHERRRLLSVVTGQPLHKVYIGMELTDRQARRLRQLGLRRMSGEPLQYLEGVVQFGPIELAVDRRALIPRPETERLWERTVELMFDGEPGFILDLCTGTGCLALALKHSFPGAHVVAADLSTDALALARDNARNLGAVVEIREGDLFEALPGDLRRSFDLIVSNPPYVPVDARLPLEVRDHEPHLALFGGPDGLDVIRRIVSGSAEWLSRNGLVALEVGEGQVPSVPSLFAGSGFESWAEPDLAGRSRFVFARRA